MLVTTTIRRCKAVLKMPRRMGDKLIKALSIERKLQSTSYFTSSSWPDNIASLAQLGTDIQSFLDTEAIVQTGLKGSAANRNAALFILMQDLRGILSMVQTAADKDPANAIVIIESAGYEIKRTGSRSKLQNDAFNTEIAGMVLLTADGGRGHEWQMSRDQTTIINLPSTQTAQTLVEDLIPNDVWYFRNRKINTKKNIYNWSPWKKLIIGPGGRVAGGNYLGGQAGSISTH
jgi:hypothetical protein